MPSELPSKYVLFYDSAPNSMAKAREVFPRHEMFFCRYVDDGTVIAIGTLGDPQQDGSMAVFTTREAAESFAQSDPFVLEGVVSRWRVLEWREAIWER